MKTDMTNTAKKSLRAFLVESFLFSVGREYTLLIVDSILDDVAQDISETAGEDYGADDIHLSVGRVLCKRLNLKKERTRSRFSINDDQKSLFDGATSDLIDYVMRYERLPMQKAMDVVYESKLHAKMADPLTGLYREGPVYLYDMLCEERGIKSAVR